MWIIYEDCKECTGTGSPTILGLDDCQECHGSGERQWREEDYNYTNEDGVRKDYPDALQVFKTKYK